MKKNIAMIIVFVIIIIAVISINKRLDNSADLILEWERSLPIEAVKIVEPEPIKPWANLINKETGEIEWSEYKLHYTETGDNIICADYNPESKWFGTIFVSGKTVIIPADWKGCNWPGNTYDHLLQQAGIDWKSMWFYKEPSDITGHQYVIDIIEG